MKKLCFMIFIFCVLIFVCVFEQVILNKYFTDIQKEAKQIEVLTQNTSKIDFSVIDKKVEILDNKWNKYEKSLAYFINHKDMQNLCIEIKQLSGHIKAQNYQNFVSSLKVVIHLIDDYKNLYTINF